jgi:hypothetical protein
MFAVAAFLYPAKAQAAYTPQSTSPDFTLSLNPSLTNYQYGPGARTNWTLTSVNGFQGVVNMNYFWLNGSSDIFVGLVNPYLSAGGTFTDQIKVFSPPISIGCCGILQVTATSGSLSHSANFTIAVPPGPDFAVTIAPKTLDVPQGTIVTANVTVTNIDGFSGSVFFTSGVSPGNAGAFSVSPTSVNLAPGTSGTVVLTIDTTTAAQNTYNFTVTAYDLGHSHPVKLTLKVLSSSAGFTITQTPSLVTIRPGSFFALAANVTSINGFFGNATLTVAPNTPSLIANLTTRMIVLQPNSTIFIGINVTASNAIPPGTYSVTVSASCNTIIHSIAITVVIPFPPSFAITLAQSQLRIQPGSSATDTITLSGISNFNGTITVTTQVVGAGLVTSLSSRTVTLTYLASATTITLTVSLPSNAPSDSNYTITINATDGLTTHQASMTVAATATSGAQPPPLAVGLNLIYIVTGLVAATIASTLAVLMITKHRKATPIKATGAVDSP